MTSFLSHVADRSWPHKLKVTSWISQMERAHQEPRQLSHLLPYPLYGEGLPLDVPLKHFCALFRQPHEPLQV